MMNKQKTLNTRKNFAGVPKGSLIVVIKEYEKIIHGIWESNFGICKVIIPKKYFGQNQDRLIDID